LKINTAILEVQIKGAFIPQGRNGILMFPSMIIAREGLGYMAETIG
jgi:hypothetical protein